jgi:acyl-CoA reductase-like NAD-dependent aldehyde dehydrogenase
LRGRYEEICGDAGTGGSTACLAREPVPTEARKSFITFNPIGVVLAVMPWNFPFWQVFRFAGPSLMEFVNIKAVVVAQPRADLRLRSRK